MQIRKPNYFFLIPQDKFHVSLLCAFDVLLSDVLRGLGIQKVNKVSIVLLKGPTKIFSYRQG